MIERAIQSPDFWLLALMLALGAWTALTIWRESRSPSGEEPRNWRPRASWGGSTICGLADDDYEGGYLVIEWLGFCVELSWGRAQR